MRFNFLFFFLFFSTQTVASNCPEKTSFKGPSEASILELYTSEGCSSCPPADRYLSSLASNERLFKDLFPLNFHVDYWDYLGWKDRLARKEFTQRQYHYGKVWGNNRVYTPGMVLNGKEWRGWYQRSKVTTTPLQGKLSVDKIENRLEINYQGKNANSFTLAVLGMGIQTSVQKGENAGKDLKHNFVVLDWKTGKLDKGKASTQISRPSEKAQQYAVVVWVHESNQLAINQIAGSCIKL